jgi:uncharacterized membrane protein affecting hemolysin expression
MPNKDNNNKMAPNLLRGILLGCIGITSGILLLTWSVIDLKIDELVTQRTSEYAHSIARIAADSSAEPLLSEDIVQLNSLVENVARDPIIKQATVYSEDGLIISQYPSEQLQEKPIGAAKNQFDPTEQSDNPDSQRDTESNDKKIDFLKRQKNIPFIEKITYQGVTAGWFKLEVDSFLLEKNLRTALIQVQMVSGAGALLLFALLIFLLLRMEIPIKRLAENCHHLLIQNRIKPPKSKKQWLAAMEQLANEHPQQFVEHIQLPSANSGWEGSTRLDNVITVVIQFDIKQREDIDYAEQLSLAERYLNESIQAFGVQAQGDILTGCLIPFTNNHHSKNGYQREDISNALCFIALVQKLMSTLTITLSTRVSLSCSNLILLENDNELVTGVTIIGEQKNTLEALFVSAEPDEIICLSVPSQELEAFAEIKKNSEEHPPPSGMYKLSGLNQSMLQQVTRKFNYIAVKN